MSKVMEAQVRQIAAARDGGRERMLAAVLRTLGGCSEDNASNASKVIAARGHLPSFQLLNSRLPTIRREAAFCVASLFQVSLKGPFNIRSDAPQSPMLACI